MRRRTPGASLRAVTPGAGRRSSGSPRHLPGRMPKPALPPREARRRALGVPRLLLPGSLIHLASEHQLVGVPPPCLPRTRWRPSLSESPNGDRQAPSVSSREDREQPGFYGQGLGAQGRWRSVPRGDRGLVPFLGPTFGGHLTPRRAGVGCGQVSRLWLICGHHVMLGRTHKAVVSVSPPWPRAPGPHQAWLSHGPLPLPGSLSQLQKPSSRGPTAPASHIPEPAFTWGVESMLGAVP